MGTDKGPPGPFGNPPGIISRTDILRQCSPLAPPFFAPADGHSVPVPLPVAVPGGAVPGPPQMPPATTQRERVAVDSSMLHHAHLAAAAVAAAAAAAEPLAGAHAGMAAPPALTRMDALPGLHSLHAIMGPRAPLAPQGRLPLAPLRPMDLPQPPHPLGLQRPPSSHLLSTLPGYGAALAARRSHSSHLHPLHPSTLLPTDLQSFSSVAASLGLAPGLAGSPLLPSQPGLRDHSALHLLFQSALSSSTCSSVAVRAPSAAPAALAHPLHSSSLPSVSALSSLTSASWQSAAAASAASTLPSAPLGHLLAPWWSHGGPGAHAAAVASNISAAVTAAAATLAAADSARGKLPLPAEVEGERARREEGEAEEQVGREGEEEGQPGRSRRGGVGGREQGRAIRRQVGASSSRRSHNSSGARPTRKRQRSAAAPSGELGDRPGEGGPRGGDPQAKGSFPGEPEQAQAEAGAAAAEASRCAGGSGAARKQDLSAAYNGSFAAPLRVAGGPSSSASASEAAAVCPPGLQRRASLASGASALAAPPESPGPASRMQLWCSDEGYQCRECGALFDNAQALGGHMTAHTKRRKSNFGPLAGLPMSPSRSSSRHFLGHASISAGKGHGKRLLQQASVQSRTQEDSGAATAHPQMRWLAPEAAAQAGTSAGLSQAGPASGGQQDSPLPRFLQPLGDGAASSPLGRSLQAALGWDQEKGGAPGPPAELTSREPGDIRAQPSSLELGLSISRLQAAAAAAAGGSVRVMQVGISGATSLDLNLTIAAGEAEGQAAAVAISNTAGSKGDECDRLQQGGIRTFTTRLDDQHFSAERPSVKFPEVQAPPSDDTGGNAEALNLTLRL